MNKTLINYDLEEQIRSKAIELWGSGLSKEEAREELMSYDDDYADYVTVSDIEEYIDEYLDELYKKLSVKEYNKKINELFDWCGEENQLCRWCKASAECSAISEEEYRNDLEEMELDDYQIDNLIDLWEQIRKLQEVR